MNETGNRFIYAGFTVLFGVLCFILGPAWASGITFTCVWLVAMVGGIPHGVRQIQESKATVKNIGNDLCEKRFLTCQCEECNEWRNRIFCGGKFYNQV